MFFQKIDFFEKIKKIDISPKIDFGLGIPIKNGVEGHAGIPTRTRHPDAADLGPPK